MRKVLLVANTDWYLYNFRLSLAESLKQRNFEVVFVCPPGSYVSRLQECGFRWVEWRVHRKLGLPWNELSSLLGLSRIFRREKPHLVHSHTLKAVLYCCIAGLIYKKPGFINSIAGRGHLYSSRNPLYSLLGLILDLLFRIIDRRIKPVWIFENRFDFDYFVDRKLITGGNAHLVEGVGVDIDKFPMVPEPEGVPQVLYVGRFLWSKGLGDLVEAIRFIKGQGIGVNLTLVGQPDQGNPDSISLSTLEDWKNEGLVNWVGWQEETAIWYQKTNIFAFPTKYGEGVPTVLLEAASSGRAIVTTKHPGCMAVVNDGESGVLVPPGDVALLAGAIQPLLSDAGLRQRMGLAARAIVERKFSKELINAKILVIYDKVLARNSQSA